MSDQSTAALWAVVPAAGVGERMQLTVPKQYHRIGDRTVLQRTLESLLALQAIQGIQVSIAQHDQYWPELGFDHQRLLPTVIGGATRAESVLSGLLALQDYADEQDWVLVHDAARPCLSLSTLERLVQTLRDHPVGGLLALPIADTVKKADSQNRAINTIDRTDLWVAQTPQMFRLGLLKEALQRAITENWSITDESSAIERLGLQPMLIEGDPANIKMTYPGDENRLKAFFFNDLAQ